MSLKSKNLLIIAPNTHDIINDQTTLVSKYFNKTDVLVPIPYFSSIALNLPYFKKNFQFLKINLTMKLNRNYATTYFKFFNLPIEVMRKRTCIIESKSCIKKVHNNCMVFDIIHTHFLYTGFSGASLKEIYNKPLVITAHGGDVYDLPFKNTWYNNIARYILHEADQVITVSKFNAKKISSLGVSSKKLHVIYNGYRESLFRPLPLNVMRNKLELPLGKKIILTVGNLVDIKGHSFLIEAMNIIQKKRDDVLLVIIGSGKLSDVLLKKINVLGLNNQIFLVGSKAHEEIPLWMNASDIFVLPSLGEGFPAVIPEALACGKPVIGTYVGGVPEALSNQDVGSIVNPRDSAGLADAILVALEKHWDSETILNYAKQYAWNNLVKQVLSVYEHI